MGFENQKGKLDPIIDPTIIASLVRNVYETVGTFNLIYFKKTGEERLILYHLWVIAGLKYRQRFAAQATTEENKEKVQEEKKAIDDCIATIKDTGLFNNLTEENRAKILDRIKAKEFRIKFNAAEVKILNSWQELSSEMEFKEGFFDNIYTYFSLYAHPSNVSVFQFKDMFAKDKKEHISLVLMNMKFCFTLFGTFIFDYIQLFPETMKIFEQQPILNQIMLNFHNRMLRGEKYSINDSYKYLG